MLDIIYIVFCFLSMICLAVMVTNTWHKFLDNNPVLMTFFVLVWATQLALAACVGKFPFGWFHG